MLLPCHCSCTATSQSICIFSRADKRAVGWRSIANNNKHYYDYSVQAQAQALNADFESLKLLQLQPVLFVLPAPCSLIAGRGLTWMGMWYIKFHDAKWMIICDYTRQQVRYMVSAKPWAERHTHTRPPLVWNWMKVEAGEEEANWTTTKPIQICVPLRPGSRPFLLSLALCAAFCSTPDSGIHTTYTYVHMYIRSWCSWLCVNGQRTRFYIERQIGC